MWSCLAEQWFVEDADKEWEVVRLSWECFFQWKYLCEEWLVQFL